MSVKFKLVRAYETPVIESNLDWSKCMFCQSSKNETLRCPATSSRFDSYGYEKLAENLMNFQALNAQPKSLQFSKLNDKLDIQEKLSTNATKFHQTFRLK